MSIASSDVFKEVRQLLAALFPSTPIIKGLANGIAMPIGGFIIITPVYQKRMGTNINTYIDPITVVGEQIMTQSTEFTIQIDCYGTASADMANKISIAFRSEYGVELLAPNCSPLYIEEPKQLPLVDAENQYEQRWMIMASFQFDPSLSVPMQFFTTAQVSINEVS